VPRAVGHLLAHLVHERGERLDRVEDRHAGRTLALAAVQDAAAQADPGRAEPVDLDAQCVRVDPRRLGPDHQRRSSGAAGLAGHRLADQSRRGQLGGQGADGAAVEAEPVGELGPRRRAVQVDVAQQGAEVVPAYLLRAGAGPHQRAVPVPEVSLIGFR
jgi:hypothetical protein